jgi:hypothetical protein
VKALWLTILALILGFATQAQAVLFAKSAAFRTFNPSTYDANVGQWCAARLQTGFANSDPVGTYTDSSGNARNFTSSGSSRPTFTTSAVNGLPALNFDGSDDWMSAGDVLDLGTGGMTLMVLCKFDVNSNAGIVVKSFAGDATGRWALFRESSVNQGLLDEGATSATPSYAATSTAWSLLTLVIERNVSARIYENGVLKNTVAISGSTDFNTAYYLLLGAYNNGTDGLGPIAGYYFNGQVAESVLWREALGTSAREGAEDALGSLYGITITH